MVSSQIDIVTSLSSSTAAKAPCVVATFSPITLSGEQTIQGITTMGSRVLVAGQANTTTNGIYITNSGSWQYAADWNNNDDIAPGTLVPISGGTFANFVFVLECAIPIIIGATAITFASSQNLATQPIFNLMMYYPGVPQNSQVFSDLTFLEKVTFSSGFTGGYVNSRLAATNSQIEAVMYKNGSSFASISCTSGATAGSFSSSAQAVFNAGDRLAIIASSGADPTFGNIGISLYGVRSS